MSSWPTTLDFSEAIRDTSICFSDPDLKGGKVEINLDGSPKPRTGSCASVYKISQKENAWAVKCFHRHIPDQHIRYAAIESALTRTAFPFFIKCEYLPKGINVRGSWFPILKMAWSNGETLDNYLFNSSDTFGPRLNFLVKDFKDVCNKLQRASLAHGDLQHGNIVIETGRLRLVDYDNFFVPALSGKSSHELGHPNYQHPGRTTEHYGPYLDNFGAWVIHTSLYCLSIDPQLWHRLAGGDECLLFRSSDFADPCASYTFSLLERHSSEEIRKTARLLRSFCDIPPDKVPWINDSLVQPEDIKPLRAIKTVPSWIKNVDAASFQRQTTDQPALATAYSPFRDFNEAVKFPTLNFEDPELRKGMCILEDTTVGRNGRVYHFMCEDRDVAVKCFTFPLEGRRERYEEIEKVLQGHLRKYVSQVRYLEKGIRVGDNWCPILKMDWIEGKTIKELATGIVNDATCSYLAERFADMIKLFRSAGIAHGDLDFNNLIFSDNELKVVDYDSMFVPALTGKKGLECGNLAFQHPGRTASDFGPHLDNFSAWLIFHLLRHLSSKPLITELVDIALQDERQTMVQRSCIRAMENERDAETRQIGRLLSCMVTYSCATLPALNSELGFENTLVKSNSVRRESAANSPFIKRRPKT